MQRIGLAILCSALATTVLAAPKDCEELKKEIEVKIQAKAIPSYTLEIVSKEEAEKHDVAMVVGTCEYGTKAIIYQKNEN
ncbi:DUF1161 domain-containing protein [Pseudomonas sp. Eth.TT006]